MSSRDRGTLNEVEARSVGNSGAERYGKPWNDLLSHFSQVIDFAPPLAPNNQLKSRGFRELSELAGIEPPREAGSRQHSRCPQLSGHAGARTAVLQLTPERPSPTTCLSGDAATRERINSSAWFHQSTRTPGLNGLSGMHQSGKPCASLHISGKIDD